jgi:hypothetical protein
MSASAAPAKKAPSQAKSFGPNSAKECIYRFTILKVRG